MPSHRVNVLRRPRISPESESIAANAHDGLHMKMTAVSQWRARRAAHTWTMTTNTPHPKIARGRRWRLPLLICAGAATLAVLAGYDATQPATTAAPPGFSRAGGFAADEGDDQTQLQQQLNQQQLQQSMQQAEQQNEQAQQQFNQDMQQQQTYENQFNNP